MTWLNFFDWLSVYEYEKQRMNFVMVPKKQKTKMVTRRKTTMCSRSNVLKKIVDSLQNEQYQHMLYWHDKTKKEFIVKFVHMNNPEWKNADYLVLFKELDKLSNSYNKYEQDEKYDHKCKVRCKANLRKLVENGALTFMGKTLKEKSIQLRKYKLNFDVSSDNSALSKGGEITKRYNVNGFSGCETVQGSTYIKGKFKIENLPNEQSHCLCLSKPNSINIWVNIPVGGTSISSVNTNGHPLLDTCCTTENRNQDTRNVILQNQPLTAYEHEKQMDKKDDALHAISIENPVLFSSFTSLNIEENDKCEWMESHKLDQRIQATMEIQNNGAIPTNYMESLNIESVGKSNLCVSLNDEALGAINLTGKDNAILENEWKYIYNAPNGLQVNIINERCQDMDFDVQNYAQLVPCSPQNHGEFNNELLSECFEDCSSDVNKILQQDNDPFLSDIVSDDLNNSFLEEFEINNEEFSSFANNGI